jgi:hypothetical protein
LLGASLTTMPACIIPVGPDFQDPVSSPNYAPYLTNPNPAFGTVQQIASTQIFPFVAYASDPNGDTLYFQWVIDYPPYTQGTTSTIGSGMVPSSTSPPGTELSVPISCASNPRANATSLHQLELIVADRPFTPAPTGPDLDIVPSPGLVTHGDWTFYLSCPQGGSQ